MGQNNQEDILGKTDFDFLRPDQAKKFYTDEQNLVQSGQPLLNHEEWFMDLKGHYLKEMEAAGLQVGAPLGGN